jgi:hypothetical protein
MGFSYKTLSSNDITLTSYIANKFWEVKNTTLSENGVTIYIGENLPINRNFPFNPENDTETSNDEYRRLIFESIKHLFYKNYISGSSIGQFFNSSSYFNYEQSTLASGSDKTTLRFLPQVTGSDPYNPASYDDNILYDEDSLYDETSYDGDRGSKIAVISIDQNIFGSGLSPNSVFISGSNYYLRDDGEGNFYDFYTESNYENPISSSLIGNIFYSHGLIVITNEDYLCVFGSPPTALNDYLSYFNLDVPQTFDILANDFTDCGFINFDGFTTHSIEGYNFPTFTYNNGVISIPAIQQNLIPGDYKLGYTITNDSSITSNTASINLNVTSLPLEITNIITPNVCYGNTSVLPVTFSINYGVPYYSYSLDNGVTYNGINDLFNITVSGSMTASINNIIYVQDYLGNIVTSSYTPWYPAVEATIELQKPPCSDVSSDGRIFIYQDQTAISASVNFGPMEELPALFTGIPTGSINIDLIDINGCTTSSILEVGIYPPLTASITQSNITCYGNSNGFLRINLTNVIDTLYVDLQDPTGSYIYSNIPLSNFINNSITASNLSTGSYDLSVFSIGMLECQGYNNTFTLTSPELMSYTFTASYIDSCSNQILFNDVTGGTPPYTFIAIKSGSGEIYSSNTSTVDLETLEGGLYTSYIVDNNACQSFTSSIELFGRQFIYSGSECSTEVLTPFIAITGFRKTFNLDNTYSYSFIVGDTSGSFDIYSQTSLDNINWSNTQLLSGSTSPQVIGILDTPPFYTRLFVSNSLGESYSNVFFQNN